MVSTNAEENHEENNSLMQNHSSISIQDHCLLNVEIKDKHCNNSLEKPNGASTTSLIDINFKDLKYSVKPILKERYRKNILHRVNGYFNSNSLNAIIGPSGAGKTSLLSIICGFKSSKHKQGSIYVNGCKTNGDVLRKITCYVPQEFFLLPWLTTKETLYFAARLKITRSERKHLQQIVRDVADKLGLLNSLETLTERLSGGEKKRLSIGVEIVTDPKVLILDEPTSGLDSASSNQVITLLKNMSLNGCNVICAVHQPSSQMMTLFDNLLVLANGRELYCGPQKNIVESFQQAGFICPPFYNIGEFVIEVATGQRNGDLDLLRKLSYEFQSSRFSNHIIPDEKYCNELIDKKNNNSKEQSIITWTDELRVLLWRAITCIKRDNTMTKLRLSAHILIGFLLGILFRNFGEDASKTPSNIASLFFFLLFLFFSNAMPAVQMFPVEAAVFIREHSNNWYRLLPYYISKTITDLPLQILCPTLFLAIAYCLTGQPLEINRFTKVWLICFLITTLAQSFGILTGAAFNTHCGCFLVPALNIPMFLFAGFFIKLNEVPSYLYPMCSISYFRYAFEGMLQAIYGDNRPNLRCNDVFCMLKSPKIILSYMDMPSTSFTVIIVVLLSWILALHTLILIVLKLKFVNTCKK